MKASCVVDTGVESYPQPPTRREWVAKLVGVVAAAVDNTVTAIAVSIL